MTTRPQDEAAELLNNPLDLPAESLNSRLLAIWPHLHAPLRTYEQARVIALFRRAGFVSDGEPFPNHGLTIYRGAPTAAKQPGISWTLCRQVASRYARDYSTTGATKVWQATAAPGAVLARFCADNEVVVDPDRLTDMAVIGHFTHFGQPM